MIVRSAAIRIGRQMPNRSMLELEPRALTLVAATHLALRRLEAFGRRHFVLEQRGEVVAAPCRGASPDLG